MYVLFLDTAQATKQEC